MTFYTNVCSFGANIGFRGYNHLGRRLSHKVKYQPTLYKPTKLFEGWSNVYGAPVRPVRYDNTFEARADIKKAQTIAGYHLYGMTRWPYAYIDEEWPDKVPFNLEHLRIVYIDIEVFSESGFPHAHEARWPITAITIRIDGASVTFGCNHYRGKHRFVLCESESDLILKFINVWRELDPDIVSGWNIRTFDIPYLCNRIKRTFDEDGDKTVGRLSPWGIVNDDVIRLAFKEQQVYNIFGVAIIDYLELYMKYGGKGRPESYTLNHIAHTELGEKKLDYSEVGDLNQLYKLNYDKFIDYNAQDAALVEKLEDKRGLISMAVSLAYMAKVNFEDSFKQTRIWDALIHSFLIKQKKVIPVGASGFDGTIKGAWVKDIQLGRHGWVVGFDLDSMYPHLMMGTNISPDTLVTKRRLSQYHAAIKTRMVELEAA